MKYQTRWELIKDMAPVVAPVSVGIALYMISRNTALLSTGTGDTLFRIGLYLSFVMSVIVGMKISRRRRM